MMRGMNMKMIIGLLMCLILGQFSLSAQAKVDAGDTVTASDSNTEAISHADPVVTGCNCARIKQGNLPTTQTAAIQQVAADLPGVRPSGQPNTGVIRDGQGQ